MKPGLDVREDLELHYLPDSADVVEVAPRKEPATPREWMIQNLFSSPLNTLLTIVAGTVVVVGGVGLMRWIFVTADWGVVKANLRVYMVGRFPLVELWRVWASTYFVTFLAGLSWGVVGRLDWTPRRTLLRAVLASLFLFALVYLLDGIRIWVLCAAAAATFVAGALIGRAGGRRIRVPLALGWTLAFPVVIVLLRLFGGVPPRLWGGFMLNLLLAVVGIFVSFPIGLLLALGRRSTLPVVSLVSVTLIEFIRGVPLVTLLIFGQFVLPLLLPPGMALAAIVRAMIMIIVFSAAYIAEIVRGGLQGVPAGQYEAARAVGLSTTRMMALVILPQALRNTIPATIGQYISLFKDTSLVAILGLIELLNAARNAPRLEFSGDIREALLGAAFLFWLVAFSMSRWSQRLEGRLGLGER